MTHRHYHVGSICRILPLVVKIHRYWTKISRRIWIKKRKSPLKRGNSWKEKSYLNFKRVSILSLKRRGLLLCNILSISETLPVVVGKIANSNYSKFEVNVVYNFDWHTLYEIFLKMSSKVGVLAILATVGYDMKIRQDICDPLLFWDKFGINPKQYFLQLWSLLDLIFSEVQAL